MKKLLFYSLILSLILTLSSCYSVRNKILTSGEVKQEDFLAEIPFNFEYGLPIIKVKIDEIEYNFLVDTGAPTVLSPELYKTLKLKRMTTSKVVGSEGNRQKENLVLIENIKIDTISFDNIGAVIVDFSNTVEINCLNLDGIIGSNLMSLAIWEFDYSNQKIRLTNSRNKLNIDQDSYVLNFQPAGMQGTPKVDIYINNKKAEGITFDTGSNSDFSVNLSEFNDVVSNAKNIETFGSSSTGIYGKGVDRKSLFSKVNSIKLGTLNLQNQILEFEENASRTLGNKFLQNYKVVIDWNLNQIDLSSISDFDNSQLNTFGFHYKVLDKKLYVGTIYKNSEAEQKGLQINDEISAINELDLTNLSEEDLCNFLYNNLLKEKNNIRIDILRKGKKLTFDLNKQLLIK